MRLLKYLPLLALTTACIGLAGCIMIQSSSISGSAGPGTAVTGQANDMGILHLSVPQNLTQTANSQLLSGCASGKVTDVQTELSMRDFILVQMYKVSASGVCQ